MANHYHKRRDRVVIFHSDRYDLVSLGNGAAYEVHDNEARVSAFIQYGDEATAFREEFDAWPGDYNGFCAEQIAIRE